MNRKSCQVRNPKAEPSNKRQELFWRVRGVLVQQRGKTVPKMPRKSKCFGISITHGFKHLFSCCPSQVNIQDLTSLLSQILPPPLLLLAAPKNPLPMFSEGRETGKRKFLCPGYSHHVKHQKERNAIMNIP